MSSSSTGDLARVEKELLARWPESRLEPSLTRINALVDLLGSPHRAMPVVQVAGTNGKTTTARMIDELLRGFGLRVGRFTSPHLESIRERIVLDGEPVSAERFVETYDDIAPYVQMVDAGSDVPMSFFEVMVGMAYALFADAPVDVAVIEVGMGGTWDATNVADARVAVVTPVALDHAEYLGPDVAHDRRREGRDHQGRLDRRARPPAAGRARRPGAPGGRGGGRRRPRGHRVRRAGAPGRRRRPAGAAAGAGRRVRGDLPAAVRRPPGAERGRPRWPRSRRSSAPARRPGRSSRTTVRAAFAAVRSPGRLERVRTLADRAGRRRAQPGRHGRDRRRDQGVLRLHPAGRRRRLRRAARTSPACSPRSRTSAPSSSSPRTARRGRCRPTSWARSPSTSSAPTGSASHPRLAEALEEAIELAEAGPDDALGGSGVLVTGSVITAGEARTLLAGRRS